MKDLYLDKIIQVTKGTMIGKEQNLMCNEFSIDTRSLKDGDVYIGIKGENFDGNSLYKEAFEKGAKLCILNQEMKEKIEKEDQEKDKTILFVEDTMQALGKIAEYKRSLYSIPVVAITGSVGKTSTKDMIGSVIAQKYKVHKTQGNYNNAIGLPLTILGLKDEEVLVVEMGMNHFGEIDYLTNIAKPTIAVITNIGTSHIGNLGSRENILKAKLEILNGLQDKGTIIINQDNDLLQKWAKEDEKYHKLTYGIEEKSDVMAEDIKIQETESKFKIKEANKTYEIEVPISGKHFIYNSLSAIAVGKILEIPMEQIIKGIKDFKLTNKRMDIQTIEEEITVINDSYNASYDSMKASLEYMHKLAGKRKIAILGDMLELGKFAKQLHQKVGEEVVINEVDLLITVGPLAHYIAEEAIEKGMKEQQVIEFLTNKEVVFYLKQNMKKGDIILLKASNALNFTQILEELKK